MVLQIPLLQDESLLLRPHLTTDADAVVARSQDPLTVAWTTVPLDYTREMALNYISAVGVPQQDTISWALEYDGQYAGSIDLRRQGAGTGGLGFVTSPEFRGRGLMSRAVRLAVSYAFDTLGWEALNWTSNVGNLGSYKTVWRNGFPLPVTVPRLLAHRGEMVDGWFSELEAAAPRIPRILWSDALALLPHVPQAPDGTGRQLKED
ncbi:GNAT family N-acetyltransferase [Arthrobacter gandavensis]|uniref:GNAT family N-acetyltransferase n=1 Tax=Arthrobacter gandavensis TaxID=169960 RepID=UPI00188E9C93|nr:GNAT family N-acetyltransferase [Arthrobacter gandavensis]MBF4995477.1 GNAT family N-acetyltransferase [Arthrobacter gandavensis]